MTAGSWPAIETVREALSDLRGDSGLPVGNGAPLAALARLEAICEAAEHSLIWAGSIEERQRREDALREALAKAQEPGGGAA